MVETLMISPAIYFPVSFFARKKGYVIYIGRTFVTSMCYWSDSHSYF